MATTRIADLAEYVAARRRIYDEALAADMRRLAKAHGEGPVREGLALIGQRARQGKGGPWDSLGHAQAVRAGIAQVLAERQLSAPETEPLPEPPPGWR